MSSDPDRWLGQIRHLRWRATGFAAESNDAALRDTLLEINRVRVLAEWPERVLQRENFVTKVRL